MSDFELDLVNDPIEELYICEHVLSIDEVANHDLLCVISLAIMARAEEPLDWPMHQQAEEALHHIPHPRQQTEIREVA